MEWKTPFKKVLNTEHAPMYKWFEDGTLNVSYNCLDRQVAAGRGDKVAIIFEADDGKVTHTTYAQLLAQTCRMANALKALGVGKGDRVAIYMSMSVEAVAAMQACARLGAVHSVVFGGFSAHSLRDRIADTGAVAVITADEQVRGGKTLPLKALVDEALALGGCEAVRNVIVYRRTGGAIAWQSHDRWMHELTQAQPEVCEPEWVGAEHPLFLLYTSGSTGKPKGVQHSSGGYLVQAAVTAKWTFDLHDDDVFWCTADIGWVTGHSYIAYGPLALGATEVVFEGVPTYPDAARFWKMIEKHKVTVFYTAPTAIRSLIKAAEGHAAVHPRNFDLTQPAHPGLGRRADQPGCLGVVPRACRRRPLPDRRHLVADGDRRPHDHAASGRDRPGAGLLHLAVPGHHGRDRRRDRRRPAERAERHPRDQEALARHDPDDLGRRCPLPVELLPARTARLLPGRRWGGARRRKRATSPSAGASTTC